MEKPGKTLLEWFALSLVAWVITLGIMVAALCASGCTPASRVTIANWPKTAEPVECYIADMPVAPTFPDWPTEANDYYMRVYVHRRDYEATVQFNQDMALWAGTVRECLNSIASVQ